MLFWYFIPTIFTKIHNITINFSIKYSRKDRTTYFSTIVTFTFIFREHMFLNFSKYKQFQINNHTSNKNKLIIKIIAEIPINVAVKPICDIIKTNMIQSNIIPKMLLIVIFLKI